MNRHERRAASSTRGTHRPRLDRNQSIAAEAARVADDRKVSVAVAQAVMKAISDVRSVRLQELREKVESAETVQEATKTLSAHLDLAAAMYFATREAGDAFGGLVAVADMVNAVLAGYALIAAEGCSCENCEAIRKKMQEKSDSA